MPRLLFSVLAMGVPYSVLRCLPWALAGRDQGNALVMLRLITSKTLVQSQHNILKVSPADRRLIGIIESRGSSMC